MKKTFYQKMGRRYVPVREYDDELMWSFPKGAHLVVCRPGQTLTRYDVDPEFAPLIAAGLYAEDAVIDAVHKASELRPAREPITEQQRAAWNALAEAFGDDLATLHGSSPRDIAQASLGKMVEEANRLMQNPAVRKAYEDFLFVCKLTQESEHA